jgi:hypothetical protein
MSEERCILNAIHVSYAKEAAIFTVDKMNASTSQRKTEQNLNGK